MRLFGIVFAISVMLGACTKAQKQQRTAFNCEANPEACNGGLEAPKADTPSGLADFSATVPKDNTPGEPILISWESLEGSKSYTIAIGLDKECKNNVAEVHDLKETSQRITITNDGTFYVCVSAIMANGDVVKSKNTGAELKVGSGDSSNPSSPSNNLPVIAQDVAATANLGTITGSGGTSGDPFTFSVNQNSTNGVFAFTVTDADGDATTLVTAAPSWITVDHTNKKLTFAPLQANVGNVQFNVAATDGKGNSNILHFDVTVVDVNDAPTIAYSANSGVSSWAGDGSSGTPYSFDINEDAAGEVSFTITDLDGQATALISCASKPAWVTVDDANDKITFAPLAAHIGTNITFNCKANDGSADSAELIYFSADVIAIDDSPVFTYSANANVTSFAGTGASGDPYTFDVNEDSTTGEVSFSLTDEDTAAGSVTISCASKPSWVTIDQGGDKITFNPVQADVANNVAFNCKANDTNTDSATIYFSVDVINVNDAPTIAHNTHPNVQNWAGTGDSGTPFDFDVNEDTSNGEITFTITDEDGGSPNIVCASLPAWITIDQANDKLTMAPLQAHVGDAQTFNCKANDGTADSATTIYFSADVKNVNDAPTITYNANANVASFAGTGDSGTPYTFDVNEDTSNGEVSFTITDEDGGSPNILCNTPPSWLTIDNANDKITFNPGNSDVANGVTFNCRSNDGTADSTNNIYFSVDALNVNDAPTIVHNTHPNVTGWGGAGTSASPFTFTDVEDSTDGEITFTLADIDPTSDTLTISCNSQPAWVSIDQANDKITFNPLTAHIGSNITFDCRVHDGTTYNTASNVFFNATIVANDTDPPPALTSFTGVTGDLAGQIKLTLDFPADVSDYDDIQIRRVSGATAPANCSSGTLETTITNFATDPLVYVDTGLTPGSTYSYLACIYDAVDNETATNNDEEIVAKTAPVMIRHYDAGSKTGVANSGDIGADTTDPWDDLDNTNDGDLVSFNFNTADSGWDGDGTVGDPYRLKFDGSNDHVTTTSMQPKTIMFLFKADKVDDFNNDYLYSQYDGTGGYNNYAALINGRLTVRYRTSSDYSTGVNKDVWYHFAMTHSGSVVKYYLDGMMFASESESLINSVNFYIGSNTSGSYNFDGSIVDFKAYSDALTEAEIADEFLSIRSRVELNPGDLTITRLVGGAGLVGGSTSVTAWGWDFSSVNSITFDGNAGTGINILDSDGKLNVSTPAGSAGLKNVIFGDGGTPDTLTAAYKYTASAVDNVNLHLDAANIDTIGGNGSARTDTRWFSLIGAHQGGLLNFDYDSNSGWDGNGTVANPYRLKFDGSNDAVPVGSHDVRSVAFWFNADKVDDFNNDYIYDQYHPIGGYQSYAAVTNGRLKVRYRSSAEYGTGVSSGVWYHYAMTFDGTTVRFYLDGVEFGSETETALGLTYMVLGANTGLSYNFDGSIAEFRSYTDGLTAAEVNKLYLETRPRYYADPGSLDVARIVGAAGATGGSASATVYGWGLSSVNSVTFDGNSGTGVTVSDSLGKVDVTSPAGSAGFVDLVAGDGGSTDTVTDGYFYTATATDNVNFHLDAANIDTIGGNGSARTDKRWFSLIGAHQGGLLNFDYNASSGWDGNGTVANPYRLKFDGSNDAVAVGSHDARSVAFWFNADKVDDFNNDYIFDQYHPVGGYQSYASVIYGQLRVKYRSSAEYRTGVSSGVWYHYAMTFDGTTVRFYLDGVEFGSEAETSLGLTYMVLGANTGLSYNFDGSIAEFRSYSDGLSASEVNKLFLETRSRYYTDPGDLTISRLVNTAGGTAGSDSLNIYGWDVGSVNSLTIGGNSGTSLTVDDSLGLVSVTTPSGTAGFDDVVIGDGGTPDTATSAFTYTASALDNIDALFDAGNINSIGARGSSNSDTRWFSLTGGKQGGLIDFDFNANSGWAGTGITTDPYRVNFDGTDDAIPIGSYNARTVSVWFRVDSTHPSNNEYIFDSYNPVGGYSHYAYVRNSTLYVKYRSSTTYSSAISTGTWYHLVVACDGSNLDIYLDNSSLGSEAESLLGHVPLVLGANSSLGYNFDGSIAEFRVYSDKLTSGEVTTLYNETKTRFP